MSEIKPTSRHCVTSCFLFNLGFLTVLFLFGLAVESSAFAEISDDAQVSCEDVEVAPYNATLRGWAQDGSECFETHLESAGYLMLDVAVASPGAVEPRFDFLGRACSKSGIPGDGYRYVERSAASMLLEIRAPGSYVFCVAAQDPRLRMDEYKLRAAFVESLVRKGGNPSEDEPDPEPATSVCSMKGGNPSEDEPDPEPTVLDRLCRSGELDDHADTPSCATPLELARPVKGEIRNEWGDDVDYFTFVLPGLRTVEIETTGKSDILGELYDRYGHRLDAGDGEGSEGDFRWVKTLAPGRYFVRLAGAGRSEGAFLLSLNEVHRR